MLRTASTQSPENATRRLYRAPVGAKLRDATTSGLSLAVCSRSTVGVHYCLANTPPSLGGWLR
jgi:hypothetical protein